MDTTTKNVIDLTAWELYALAQGYNEQDAREFYSRTDWGVIETDRVHKLQDKLHTLFREFANDPDPEIEKLVAKLTDRQKDALLELEYVSRGTSTHSNVRPGDSVNEGLAKLFTVGMACYLEDRVLVERNSYKMIRLTALGRDVVDYLRS
jgi:hypothetical protein